MSETLTATAINKTCAVTNNSTADVLVLDVYESDNTSNNQSYEQTLTPQATDTKTTVVKAGSTGNVQLDMTDDEGEYRQIYSLIMARADNLFPVKIGSAILSSSHAKPPSSYPPVTISNDSTANDAANMKEAESFYQTISAFPSSKLSTDYQAAVSGATNSANSADDMDDAVGTFFKSTKQYTHVTLDMVVAVSTYYSQYPFVWAGYSSSKTYYLYSSDGTTCESMGTVQLNVPSTIPASTSKKLPGFSVTYTPDSGSAVNLYYADGQFVEDLNKDMPDICLAGLFFLKSQLTKNAADNVIMSILSGTVQGTKVMGYDQEQKKDADGNWSGLYTLLHPKDAMGYIQLFMTFIGVVMGIEFLGKGAGWLKDKFMKLKEKFTGSEPPKDAVESARTEAKTTVKTEADKQSQELLDKLQANLDATKSLSDQVDDLQKKLQDRLNEDQRSSQYDALDSQSKILDKALEYGNNSKLVDADKKIGDNYDKLDGASTESLPDVLPEVKTSIETTTTNLKAEISRLETKVSGDAKATFEKASQEVDDAKETSDKIEDTSTDAKNGEVPNEVKPEVEVDM